MDTDSSATEPRIIEYIHPDPESGPVTGRIVSACRDSSVALQMVVPQASSLVLVADARVLGLHAAWVNRLTEGLLIPTHVIPFEPGEKSKSLCEVERVLSTMAASHVDRDCVVAGLGGGVATDMAGMVAALWMRGVRLIQIPTSLLAIADAAVGGKCAVNTVAGRNLAGCMKFPDYILIDGRFVYTLPGAELRGGLVEILKTGVLAEAKLLDMLAQTGGRPSHQQVLEMAILAAGVKSGIVERDPFDRGVRSILNFGHTVGHAIESATGYTISHGLAVAAGMRIESAVGVAMGLWDSESRGRLVSLMDLIGVDSTVRVDFDSVLPFMMLDKKNSGGRIRLSIPAGGLGGPVPDGYSPVSVPARLIRDCWNG